MRRGLGRDYGVMARLGFLAAVILAVAIFVPVALAGSRTGSTGLGYGGRGGHVQGEVQSGSKHPKSKTAPKSEHTAKTLPFTGADLAFLAGGALVLVAFGAGLRRLSRPL